MLTIAVLGAVLPAPEPAVAAGPAVVLKAPDEVQAGEPIALSLEVTGASDVAGYEALLRFDTSVAEFGGVSHEGNDVAATGRGIAALGPVERADGTSFGFYSCPVADCATNRGARTTEGASGRVQLATAHVLPTREGLLEIALGPVSVVDTAGRTISTTTPPSVVVRVGDGTKAEGRAAPPTKLQVDRVALDVTAGDELVPDVTRDGRVGNADAREVAIEWSLANSAATRAQPTLATSTATAA